MQHSAKIHATFYILTQFCIYIYMLHSTLCTLSHSHMTCFTFRVGGVASFASENPEIASARLLLCLIVFVCLRLVKKDMQKQEQKNHKKKKQQHNKHHNEKHVERHIREEVWGQVATEDAGGSCKKRASRRRGRRRGRGRNIQRKELQRGTW